MSHTITPGIKIILITLLLAATLSACGGQQNTDYAEPNSAIGSDEINAGQDTGEESKVPDISVLSRKWYLNGDTTAEYYELSEGVYNRITADGYEYGKESYSLSVMTDHYPVGDSNEMTHITFGEGMFAASGLFSSGYELLAVSDFGDTNIYVRESVIGSDNGDAAMAKFSLIYDDWKATDNSCAFSFYLNGAFEYLTRKELDGDMYSYETADFGNWVLENGKLTVKWADGTEDVCAFTGNSFYVSSHNMTVFNGKANPGILSRWYGTYKGELGEIAISESIFDNALNVSLYLNDDIGSMYSVSGMELDPEGSTAGDKYLTLHLDGDTLTIKALISYYDQFAGIYKRQ